MNFKKRFMAKLANNISELDDVAKLRLQNRKPAM